MQHGPTKTPVDRRPKVGVGVFVRRPDGTFLMGLRKGSHGADTWSIPGGLIEADETACQAAQRELSEETGLDIEPNAGQTELLMSSATMTSREPAS
jgi:8-oxo-dGTP diphosphatase